MSGSAEQVLSRFGLAVLCMLLTAFCVVLTAFYPPWIEVTCNRFMGLYVSEQREVLNSEFVGFDGVFAEAKKAATWTPPNPGSGTLFKSQEFNIWWNLLYFEWGVILILTLLAYLYLCHRMRANTDTSGTSPTEAA